MKRDFDIVILGLSITSSWGNGHATTWRSLVRGLAGRGHRILFLERDTPWYADNRDDPQPRGATTILYSSLDELFSCFEQAVSQADLVLVGSYVPDGIRVGRWVTAVAGGQTAFYDIDTPVTMKALEAGTAEYISPYLIGQYDAYLSFTGGPTLRMIEDRYGSPMARALYCSVDPEMYLPQHTPEQWDLGYLGTYSSDRQPSLKELLITPATLSPQDRFVVAGPQYPEGILWPANICRVTHLSPSEHPAFYAGQRYTLNITREAMRNAGYSPSVRLFEAAACGVPIISDWWEGLDSTFTIGKEVLVAEGAADVMHFLHDFPDYERLTIAFAARKRVLSEHTSKARAIQLEAYWKEMNDRLTPCSPRRHRRDREGASRLEAWLEPESDRQSSSDSSRAEVIGLAYTSDLHQSGSKSG